MSNDHIHQKAIKTAWVSMFSNIGMAGAKLTVGIFGNSYALIADAIESVGDVFSSLLVLVGFRYSNRPPDKNHPYGHGKAEPLIAFAVVTFLIMSSIFIVIEAIKNIKTSHQSPEPFTLWFLGVIILGKELTFQFVNRRSKETKSTSLKADAWHHRSDALTSICAFVGISLAVFFGDKWAQADDWATLFAAGFILYNAYRIFRPALGEIMDEHVYDDFIQQIRIEAEKIPAIVLVEKCSVRKSGMRFWVDVHIHVSGSISVHNGHELAHQYKNLLMKNHPEIEEVLVHVEPAESTTATL
jgi:cation diffusion facilitator family transporter